MHDYHNSLRLYPRLAAAFEQFAEQYAEGEHSGLGLGPGLHGAYLTEVAFMHQYHKYEFLYTIEYDARLVGHWGRFLDASVRIAEQAQGHDLAAVLEEQQKSQSNRPPHAAGQADLIVYSEPIFGSKWSESIINLDLTGSWESFVMVSPLLSCLLCSAQICGLACAVAVSEFAEARNVSDPAMKSCMMTACICPQTSSRLVQHTAVMGCVYMSPPAQSSAAWPPVH